MNITTHPFAALVQPEGCTFGVIETLDDLEVLNLEFPKRHGAKAKAALTKQLKALGFVHDQAADDGISGCYWTAHQHPNGQRLVLTIDSYQGGGSLSLEYRA